MRNKQRGFTLVEIAIVLVIIGLLLGGILKGQELITSARVRNIADQNSGVQAAYYGFIDRYRQIPGDMLPNLACQAIGNSVPGCSNGVGTIGGNGNGRLEQDDYKEASALWAQLSAAGFIQGAYQGGATDDASYVAQTVAPINAFNGRLMLTRTAQYVPNGSTTVRLGLIIGNKIPVNVMRELDVKVDDGMPTTGVLRSTSATSANPSTVFETGDTCVTTTGSPIWNIDANAQDCNAIYLY